MANITNPVQAFGSTGFHGCPPGLPAALAAYCKPASSEYNLRVGGNPNTDDTGLKPEKSRQATLGFRIEPSRALSFGVDWWAVYLKDRIDVVNEDVAFSDGATYAGLFSVRPDPVTGTPTLTLTQQPTNQGKARYQGLDFDVTGVSSTSLGKLTNHLSLTYMLKSDYEVVGLPGYQSSLGGYGPDTENTFRWLLAASMSLETGKWTNTINVMFKPGYRDDVAVVDPVNGCISDTCVRVAKPDGTYGSLRSVNRRVSDYGLIDWQGRYAWSKQLTLTVGVKNILDTNPPLSIMAMDGTGNMRGFDARYTDPLGRSFYATVSYKF